MAPCDRPSRSDRFGFVARNGQTPIQQDGPGGGPKTTLADKEGSIRPEWGGDRTRTACDGLPGRLNNWRCVALPMPSNPEVVSWSAMYSATSEGVWQLLIFFILNFRP